MSCSAYDQDRTDSSHHQPAYSSELQFRMLVRGVRDYAIYMLDTQGLVTSWNAGARAIKGYEEAEVLGKHFELFYTAEDRARGAPMAALEAALRDGSLEAEARASSPSLEEAQPWKFSCLGRISRC